MNLVTFIENRFQEVTFAIQSDKQYDLKKDAEIKALTHVLSLVRTMTKWSLMPKVIFQYFKMRLGFMEEPRPVMMEKAVEQKKAADKAAALKLSEEDAKIRHLNVVKQGLEQDIDAVRQTLVDKPVESKTLSATETPVVPPPSA